MTPATADAESVGSVLAESVNPLDIVLLLFAPLLSVGIFLLPVDIQLRLAFSVTDPTVWSAITATFVHFSTDHLVWNLVAYLMVVPLTYVLCVLSGQQQFYRRALVLSLFIIPYLVAGFNLFFTGSGLAGGLSSVVFVFVGFLPITLSSYIESHLELPLYKTGIPMLFVTGLSGAAVMALRAVSPQAPYIALVAIGGLVALEAGISGHVLPNNLQHYRDMVAEVARQPIHAELVIFALVFSIVLPLALSWPIALPSGGQNFDHSAHVLGYLLGYLVPYSALR